MQEEIQRLRKENQKLKLHQEILKKALGILSDVPPSGMP
jgi:transposase-like protein